MSGRFAVNAWYAALMIVVIVGLLFGHTLHAPFYLDDQWAIIDNYLLRDLPAALLNFFRQRGLSTLTFAINYRFSGLSLPPLHLTNMALHTACGLLVWQLLSRLLKHPGLALAGALLFVAHPLQTQSVTYLVQRATVLATLLFLVACLLHLHCRQLLVDGQPRTSGKYLGCWLGAIAAGAAAVLAKENTAVLPLLLLALDRLLPLPVERRWQQAVLDYLPYCVIPLLLGVITLMANVQTPERTFVLASMEGSTPLTYLVTQFSVFWVYLRLLFLPYGQALEHNYPVVTQLLVGQNALALCGLLVIVWLAWTVRCRRPLVTLGVVWFFLGLAVESSVIPLDPLFEHRLYLPMTGFLLVLLEGLLALFGERIALVVLGAALIVCLPLTWQRNALWNDPVAFYEDNLRRVPGSERASETLATLYARDGRYDDERRLLEETLRRYPRNYIVYINLAKTYAEEERMAEAFALIEEGVRQLPSNPKIYEAGAELARLQGDSGLALAYLQKGLAAPGIDRATLLNDIGVLQASLGDAPRAEQAFLDSLAADAAKPDTHLNLGKEYYAQQRWDEAFAAFGEALRLEPGNPESLEGLGMAALHMKDLAHARWAAGKLRHADRAAGQRLQTEIARLSKGGQL